MDTSQGSGNRNREIAVVLPDLWLVFPDAYDLARCNFNDEFLADIRDARVDIAARRQPAHPAFRVLAGDYFEKVGHWLLVRFLQEEANQLQRIRPPLHLDRIVRANEQAGDRALAAVEENVAVTDQLSSRGP